ncbi:MAG: type 4a pilus biogenesis protein PilO [Spongiibacteraceae bacterium]|nr:type 4a pilus biogenesis protein PilO [Spongiibacteraceae bacterium]
MSFQDTLRDLRELDLSELSFENIGSWPMVVKVLFWLAAFVLVLLLGYWYTIADLRARLAGAEGREQQLKQEFSDKAFKAANLDALRKQMEEMEVSFGALVAQLPSDTEVPGLLEDITNKGLEAGLEIKSIKLEPEQVKEFYIELPISIVVSGGYHDFGTFVSGIASLPRIVTLHDFSISPNKDGPSLTMSISAKTYRYKDA